MNPEGEKQNYDALLHWQLNDNAKCNLGCAYCQNIAGGKYKFFELAKKIGESPSKDFFALLRTLIFRIKKKSKTLRNINKIEEINIEVLTKTLEKTKKIFAIGFTGGGEPFLVPNIIDACVALTKKHYIYFNTNLSLKKVQEFAERVSPDKVLRITASFHIEALEKHNLLNAYIENFLFCRKRGFKIVAVEVAYPPLLPKVKKYKTFLEKYGIELKFNPFIGQYNGKSYPDSYREEELKIFGISEQTTALYQKGELCNAGYNVAYVQENGTIVSCHQKQKRIGHIYKEINFENKLTKCPFKFCSCPLKVYFPYLFEKAVEENKKRK